MKPDPALEDRAWWMAFRELRAETAETPLIYAARRDELQDYFRPIIDSFISLESTP